MEKESHTPDVPVAGIVYGHIAYWLVLVGICVALVGSIFCMISTGNPDSSSILGGLWNGDNIHVLWDRCAGIDEFQNNYWYLSLLSLGDRIAMIGIVISCVASVFGMWGASATMLVNSKHSRIPMRRLFIVFAIVVAAILTLSALGIISLEH